MRTSQTFKKKLLASLIATSLVALASAPTVSMAASVDATLRGHAAPGTVVTAQEVATGATRQTKTDAQGVYTLLGLPPGTYRISAGSGIERTIKLNVASTSTLDLTAQAAPTGNVTKLETVKVTALNLQDVNTSQVGSFVSTHQIQNMPAASRNFLQFADTVPGMVFARDGSSGNTSLQSGGQAGTALNVYIDGVGQKNYVLQGGIAGQNASQGNPFPQLAIAEYRVITSNYEAEYGQLSSAAVTALTKSGTNTYHGDAFVSFNSTGMRAAMPSEPAGKKTPSTDKDYGFDFGGPIIQNEMHFYIAYEGKKFNTPTTVVPSGPVQYFSQLPASALSQVGAANLPFLENNWFGKVDFEPTSRDRFMFEAHVRNETSLGGIGGVTTASAGLNTINFQKTADLRWDRSGYDWFNRLQFTYEDAFFQPTPVVLGAGNAYVPSNNQYAVILQTGTSPLAQQNKGQRGPGLRDDFTYDGLSWHGDHIIKTGLDIKQVQLTAQDAGDSNALFYYAVSPNAGTESIPFKVQFGSPAPGTSPVSASNNTMIGAYLQDNWTVNEHWTFNLGVRGDYDRTPAYLNYVTAPNVIAALNGQAPGAAPGVTYADTLAAGGVNINNYISNGHNRSAKVHFAPRLGFAFDINGDQKHVIFGGYSRAYDRNLFTILQLEQTKSALSQPTLYFNTPMEPCVASPTCLTFNPSYLGIPALQALVAGTTTGKEVDMIQNNLKTPYSDQFSLGMRNQVGEWNTSVAIARINSYNGFLFDLGNRYPDGSFWKNGSQPWSYGLPGFGPLILGTNGKETRTTQLLLSADKPWTPESGWGATIAYTYTDAKWNHDNNSLDDQYAFDESSPAAYPFIAEPVAKQRLVLAGTFSAPWDIALGARLTLASPIPDVNLACYGGPVNNGCVPIAARPQGNRFLLGGRIWGYRDFSMQATKNFKLYGLNAYARVDIINVFNWHNYTSYIENWGSNGVLNKYPVSYNPLGQISGYPRYLKVTVGVSF